MTTIRIMQPWGDPRDEYVEDDEFSVHAEIEEATLCKHCDEPIAEYDGWVHDHTANRWCENITDSEAAERRVKAEVYGYDEPAEAEPGKSLPGNWIGMSTKPEDESVSVQISLGDPRGCLTMTVRRVRDEDGNERLLLRVPNPDDSTPHVTMREIAPGTYQIG